MIRVTLSFLAALIASLALTGAAQAQLPAVDRVKRSNDLKQIGLAYHKLGDDTDKAPTKAEDLVPYLDKNQRVIDLLNKKDVVFSYGVKLIEMTDGTSNTVLAYEKDVPAKGGLVLMGDGSVKNITADDFKKAIVAKAKK